VLAVAAFVALWVVVAVGLFVLATRGTGTVAHARRDPGRRGSNITITMFVVTAVVFGVGLPLLMLTGNHHNANAQVGGIKLTADEKSGRELFGEHCGVCHTLAGANAAGKVGPNLDVLKPAQSTVLNTINNGCLPNPPKGSNQGCLGQGVMPAAVVEGQDAQNVAAFVAKVAGNE
jgi:mono/diheme cytochrome c family protein